MSEKDTAHSGFSRSAKALLIQHEELLARLSLDGYKVTLTGHSLGAGTVAIMATQLHGPLPFLEAVCFATPGCMTEGLAKKCSPYVTSVVFDDDFIPRCGTHTLLGLHNELVDVENRLPLLVSGYIAERIRAQKFSKELEDWILEKLDQRTDDKTAEKPSMPPAELPDPYTHLYPAGKIVYLYRNKAEDGVVRTEAVYANNTFFDHIEVSPSMVTDHLLAFYIAGLGSASSGKPYSEPW
uniref:sn-1-specific diacylglycerol lipase n=2 Tax=Lotharella globosa TaxID=91324 RepID=A0A7S3YSC9_9EUKA|mmetsp:Transcript_21253/g.42692  ORF Transcript_21253/g.42692 Transcript_21253/m.42692 type:complete len:239 (+) Transcript_21253:154-870(+)